MQRQRALDTLRARNCQYRENYRETPFYSKTSFRCVSTFAVDDGDYIRSTTWSKDCNANGFSRSADRSFVGTSRYKCYLFSNISDHCWLTFWSWESKSWFRFELYIGSKFPVYCWSIIFSLKSLFWSRFESYKVSKTPDYRKSIVWLLKSTSWSATG